MGFGGMSLGSLVLILLVVLLIFGTKRLRNAGKDVGEAVKSFREGVQHAEAEEDKKPDKPAE